MSIPYELSGRTRQKQRTRGALMAAARELVAQGKTPTVDEAATKAAVSRTTAYRYFPNQRALLVAAHPEIEALVWLTDIAGLSRRESVQLMRWSASALLRSALAESGKAGRQIKRRRPVEGSTRRRGSSATANMALNQRRRA